MVDRRTRREKLEAMASQTVSLPEAEIARAKLASMAADHVAESEDGLPVGGPRIIVVRVARDPGLTDSGASTSDLTREDILRAFASMRESDLRDSRGTFRFRQDDGSTFRVDLD